MTTTGDLELLFTEMGGYLLAFDASHVDRVTDARGERPCDIAEVVAAGEPGTTRRRVLSVRSGEELLDVVVGVEVHAGTVSGERLRDLPLFLEGLRETACVRGLILPETEGGRLGFLVDVDLLLRGAPAPLTT